MLSLCLVPQVGAVLHLGQPSVAVMGATPILYGETSPAGRTIQTVYEQLEQQQIHSLRIFFCANCAHLDFQVF